ncbi:MAG TPA: hypothetical protein VFB42_01830 [Gaiellaceae bacterium]|nr:hypothetical protein [Gaiellaceae bacterium]
MSILMIFEVPGGTVEQYHEVNERMGIRGDGDAPGGLVWHVAGRTDDGVLVADVWESREQFERFFRERAGQALADAGVEAGEPLVLPVHNLIARGAGAEPRVIVLIDVPGFGPEAYDSVVGSMPAHAGDGSQHPAASHVAAVKDAGLLIVDLWDSPEAFARFAESQVAPAAASAGLGPLEPRFVPVVNRIRGPKAR